MRFILAGVAVLVLMSRLDSGGAVFGRDKGKGGVGGGLSSPNRITLTPQVLKEGSMKVGLIGLMRFSCFFFGWLIGGCFFLCIIAYETSRDFFKCGKSDVMLLVVLLL